MRKIIRIIAGLFAVCLLTGYFFSDLNITGRAEMMSWEEFSANPVALAHFRDRAGLTDAGVVGSDLEVRRAYERYVAASTARTSLFSNIQTDANDRVGVFREVWHRVYRVWPAFHKRSASGPRQPKPARAPVPVAPERVGMALTLLTLIFLVTGVTFAIRVADEKARV